MHYLSVTTGQPVVGLFPISARLGTNKDSKFCSYVLPVKAHPSLFSSQGEMEVAHMNQTKDLSEAEEWSRVTRLTKAGKSWISHPIAPLWERRCSLCSLGSNGWTSKDVVLGMCTRALGSCSYEGHWTKDLNSLKECSGTMRGLQSEKLHGCGPRFVRGKWWDSTDLVCPHPLPHYM